MHPLLRARLHRIAASSAAFRAYCVSDAAHSPARMAEAARSGLTTVALIARIPDVGVRSTRSLVVVADEEWDRVYTSLEPHFREPGLVSAQVPTDSELHARGLADMYVDIAKALRTRFLVAERCFDLKNGFTDQWGPRALCALGRLAEIAANPPAS